MIAVMSLGTCVRLYCLERMIAGYSMFEKISLSTLSDMSVSCYECDLLPRCFLHAMLVTESNGGICYAHRRHVSTIGEFPRSAAARSALNQYWYHTHFTTSGFMSKHRLRQVHFLSSLHAIEHARD